MGDSCWMHMSIRKSDLAKAEKIFGGPLFEEEDEDGNELSGRMSEINYGGINQRELMKHGKIPFYGCHGAGGDYCECVFASFDGEMVDIPSVDECPVIVIGGDVDLAMLEAVAPPTNSVSGQITRIRKYFDLKEKAQELFEEDIQVTSA